MQMLIGQVYNVEGNDFKKKINGKTETRRRVTFRLGMQKPFKEEVEGEEKRLSTFVTCKCFNGLSETIEDYFGGEDNKGRWIQLQGHFEEESWDKTIEIDHPEDDEAVLELQVPTRQLVFIVSGFSFIGNAPERNKSDKKPASNGKNGVVVKKKKDSGNKKPNLKEIEEDVADDDAPF